MSQSSEEMTLAQRSAVMAAAEPSLQRKSQPAPGALKEAEGSDDAGSSSDSSSSDDEDVPLANRIAVKKPGDKRPRPSNGKAASGAPATKAAKRGSAPAAPTRTRANGKDDKDKIKWTTLEHGGVLFPPEYQPHGVKLKYDGVPVDLTPEQEEVATMYAAMLESDYVTQKKKTFLDNFWAEFKPLLGKGHAVKCLEKCDFRDIYDHLMAEREAKKALSKEEKLRLKEEKAAAEARFMYATVDGKREKVGNFRVEPPGLFRGRGEHPRMGKLKARIFPRDITINIGKGVPIPEHPYEGQKWKEVRHDRTVTWLAYWKDPIDAKGYKYVFLGNDSDFKTKSDLAKYEKARELKNHIERIRGDYERLWRNKDVRLRQMSTALYFIDELALRAGHEKDEDEADTVGCCTLKAENVELLDDDHIKFDFLGKDSIKYENTVHVKHAVWANMKAFKAETQDGDAKAGGDQLFDAMNAQDLNVMMKDYMDGLSVKVFRTYNASVTLDRLLWEASSSTELVEKVADYNRANKEVAVLCNHQRAVPKTHEKSMQKMLDDIEKATEAHEKLKKDLSLVKTGKTTSDGKNVSADVLKRRLDNAKARVDTLNVKKDSREELKTVALGTSKINYLDPRITVAWCKRLDMPLERIFNNTLRSKFKWAMDVEPEFRF